MTQLFPVTPFSDCGSFATAYFDQVTRAAATLDPAVIDRAAALVKATIDRGSFIYICGNGGSAGIANHSLCDFLKCVRTDTQLMPRVMSLAAHTEMNSALANDISYDEVFAYQLQSMARPGDLVWTVSSSGNSPNVVRALEVAAELGLDSISFTGFGGGRSRGMATVNLHVDAQNYGVVEDVHMGLIHIITQYLRLSHMDQSLLGQRKF